LIKNNSSTDYELVTAFKRVMLCSHAEYSLPLESHFELYNTGDTYYLECKKYVLPTLIIYYSIERLSDSDSFHLITLEQKRPSLNLLKEVSSRIYGIPRIECTLESDLAQSELKLIDHR